MSVHRGAIGFVLLLSVGAAPVLGLPVSGQVVDYRARPVVGAEVAVYEKYRQNGEEYARVAEPTVRTDEQGRFALEVDVVSQYDTFVVARKEGLALAWDGLTYGTNIQDRGHFLLVLEQPCELIGVVVDHAGRPVAGARVQAVPKTSYHSRLSQRPIIAPQEWFTTGTDAEGRFRFQAFAADVCADFRVTASGWAGTYKFTTHYQNCCGFEVGRADIRIALPQEGKVRGCVVDQDSGAAAANVTLVVRADKDQREDIKDLYVPNVTTSDANGCFVFAGVPQGRHRVEVGASEEQTAEWVGLPTMVEVKAGATADDVEVAVTKGGMIEITARGAQTGNPLRRVRAYASDTEWRLWVSGSTDARGMARLRLVPGHYDVYADAPGFLSWRAAEPTAVDLGQTVSLEVRFQPRDHVFGSVRDQDRRAVAGALVKVHPSGDAMHSDEAGRFTVGCDERRGMEGAWVIALDAERGRAAAVQVVEKHEPVEVVLEPALGVTGYVADANGAPVPAARVALTVGVANYLSSLGVEVLTDANGRFSAGVPPPVAGALDYRMYIHATDYGPKVYDRATIEGKPGGTCDLGTITLLRADMAISGVVVDSDGLPAPRIPIFLNGRKGVEQPDKATVTDEQGRFRITRICKGPLRLQANFSSSPGGMGMLDAEGGDRDVKVILGRSGVHVEFISLLGKPLPDMKNLIDLDPRQTQGKPILLCFFDMDQRPSRHCLLTLSRRAAEFGDKGLILIGVQAAKVDADALKAWATAQKVAFPVTRIDGDLEQAKTAWGVQSLPWLILTDREHKVLAEGFTLGELDSKIRMERRDETP